MSLFNFSSNQTSNETSSLYPVGSHVGNFKPLAYPLASTGLSSCCSNFHYTGSSSCMFENSQTLQTTTGHCLGSFLPASDSAISVDKCEGKALLANYSKVVKIDNIEFSKVSCILENAIDIARLNRIAASETGPAEFVRLCALSVSEGYDQGAGLGLDSGHSVFRAGLAYTKLLTTETVAPTETNATSTALPSSLIFTLDDNCQPALVPQEHHSQYTTASHSVENVLFYTPVSAMTEAAKFRAFEKLAEQMLVIYTANSILDRAGFLSYSMICCTKTKKTGNHSATNSCDEQAEVLSAGSETTYYEILIVRNRARARVPIDNALASSFSQGSGVSELDPGYNFSNNAVAVFETPSNITLLVPPPEKLTFTLKRIVNIKLIAKDSSSFSPLNVPDELLIPDQSPVPGHSQSFVICHNISVPNIPATHFLNGVQSDYDDLNAILKDVWFDVSITAEKHPLGANLESTDDGGKAEANIVFDIENKVVHKRYSALSVLNSLLAKEKVNENVQSKARPRNIEESHERNKENRHFNCLMPLPLPHLLMRQVFSTKPCYRTDYEVDHNDNDNNGSDYNSHHPLLAYIASCFEFFEQVLVTDQDAAIYMYDDEGDYGVRTYRAVVEKGKGDGARGEYMRRRSYLKHVERVRQKREEEEKRQDELEEGEEDEINEIFNTVDINHASAGIDGFDDDDRTSVDDMDYGFFANNFSPNTFSDNYSLRISGRNNAFSSTTRFQSLGISRRGGMGGSIDSLVYGHDINWSQEEEEEEEDGGWRFYNVDDDITVIEQEGDGMVESEQLFVYFEDEEINDNRRDHQLC